MKKETLNFTVHTPMLLQELSYNLPAILRVPMDEFIIRLARVADRACELNDPKLNALMMELTLYEIADPNSKEYNPEFVREYIRKNK